MLDEHIRDLLFIRLKKLGYHLIRVKTVNTGSKKTLQIYDLLKPKHYFNIADNRQTIKELHLLLATGDIYMNGENLSSKFRRKMLMGTTAGNNIKDRIARIRKNTGKPVKKRGKSITKGISKTKGITFGRTFQFTRRRFI